MQRTLVDLHFCYHTDSAHVQATDEEELTHLQNMLAQAQAAEAEANRRASEAAQRLVSTPRQRDSHTEQALQQVCALFCMKWQISRFYCKILQTILVCRLFAGDTWHGISHTIQSIAGCLCRHHRSFDMTNYTCGLLQVNLQLQEQLKQMTAHRDALHEAAEAKEAQLLNLHAEVDLLRNASEAETWLTRV